MIKRVNEPAERSPESSSSSGSRQQQQQQQQQQPCLAEDVKEAQLPAAACSMPSAADALVRLLLGRDELALLSWAAAQGRAAAAQGPAGHPHRLPSRCLWQRLGLGCIS
jgi:hypothetical protein